MNHDPDRNVTMPTGLEGEGFVILDMPSESARRRSAALDELGALDGELLWPGIEDDVRDLERLLK